MRFRLCAALLAASSLTPAYGQAPPPMPAPVPPPVVPVLVVPVRPLPPRLVAPTVIQEYFVSPTIPSPPGPVIARDYRVNRMRVTTILPLPPPPPLPPLVPGSPVPPPVRIVPREKKEAPKKEPAPKKKDAPKEKTEETATTLHVKKWVGGRLIEDEHGRQWVLVTGGAIADGPNELPGWQLPSDTDAPVFWTRSGRLFRLVMTK